MTDRICALLKSSQTWYSSYDSIFMKKCMSGKGEIIIMKKKFVLWLILLMLLSVTGCTNETADIKTPEAAAAA